MAFRKNLANRVLSLCRPSSAEALAARSKAGAHRSFLYKLLNSPAPSEQGFLRRVLLQSRSIFQSSSSSAVPLERLSLPVGDKLMEKLRSINGERMRLDVLHPPIPVPPDPEEKGKADRVAPPISVEEARKVLRVSRTEAVKARLGATGKNSISYSEFIQICCEGSSHREQGLALARALDDSGAVLILGNVVFLRPDQVARAIESVIPLPLLAPEDDPRREELREMERRKAEIDRRAEAGVRRELWCGLAFLVAQTAGFMRLTFWELSWDVMEPICFYVTSTYFMAGYAFFLRTSRDPSFEGFFESRFAAKQRRLMRAANFDLRRFNELRRLFHTRPHYSPPSATTRPPLPALELSSPLASSSQWSSLPGDCEHHYRRETLLGAVH